MAAIDQINVNIGTEQSPNYVLHDVNDKRISSTAVTTATHLLATDANLSAINPMTIANAASVLGVPTTDGSDTARDANQLFITGIYRINNNWQNVPTGWAILLCFSVSSILCTQIWIGGTSTDQDAYIRCYMGNNNWTNWVKFAELYHTS